MPGVITARTMAEVLPKRVVMRGRAFFVDLPKNRRSVIEHLPAQPNRPPQDRFGPLIMGPWMNLTPPMNLAGLHQFLERLESGHMTLRLRHNHIDVTAHEIGILKREITYLEQILAYTYTKPVAHGLYRERNGWGNQHSAHVKYDEGQELDVPEDRYRARCAAPLPDLYCAARRARRRRSRR
jgi:hypothetical protein